MWYTICKGENPTTSKLQMTPFEIAFVIKENQKMLDFFAKRNAEGDSEKVQELQASIVNMQNAGHDC